MPSRLRTAALAATALIALSAAPAEAAGARQPITGHDPFVGAVCSGGEQIVFSVESGYFTERPTDTGVAINMHYRLRATLETTGETVGYRGSQRVVLDFVAGTITESGNGRTMTLPGEGWTVKTAGHRVWDMYADPGADPLWAAGPLVEEDAEILCPLFGLTA